MNSRAQRFQVTALFQNMPVFLFYTPVAWYRQIAAIGEPHLPAKKVSGVQILISS